MANNKNDELRKRRNNDLRRRRLVVMSMMMSAAPGAIAAPAFSGNFVTSTTVDSKIAYTRASSATRTDSTGSIEVLANDVARYDYDPVSKAQKGLLIEETRTNMLTNSQGDDTTYPTRSGVTATTVAGFTAGAASGVFFADNTVTRYAYKSAAAALTAAAPYTLSFIVEMTDAGGAPTPSAATTSGDFSPIIEGDPSGLTFTVTSLGSNRYRITATRASAIGAGLTHGVAKYNTQSARPFKVTAMQLEAGSYATSYISTGASTVTRAAETATITGTNFSSFYNQGAGTLIVEGTINVTGGTFISLSDGTSNNRITLRPSGSSKSVITTGGVAQATLTGPAASVGVVQKLAVAFDATGATLVVDGAVAASSGAITVPTVDRMIIGDGASGSGAAINGHIRRIAYYPTKLSDAKMIEYTT